MRAFELCLTRGPFLMGHGPFCRLEDNEVEDGEMVSVDFMTDSVTESYLLHSHSTVNVGFNSNDTFHVLE
jgi:hypothetical protein